MAKWTISEYSHLPTDAAGNILPVYTKPRVSVGKTAAATVDLNAATRFVRFIGDTAAHVALGAAATTDNPYVPAGAEFVLAVANGVDTQLTFIAG
jgi:hypothetical protein